MRPVARERLDGPDRDTALLGGPGRGLGYPVGPSQHVGRELVKAVGVSGDVLLVVGFFGEPHIGDGQLERGVGVGEDGDPLVGVHSGAVVEVGAYIDGLETHLGQPIAQTAGEHPADGIGSGLRVAAPEQQQLPVLRDIGEDVGPRHHLAYRLAAPDMLGSPVPAFPTV